MNNNDNDYDRGKRHGHIEHDAYAAFGVLENGSADQRELHGWVKERYDLETAQAIFPVYQPPPPQDPLPEPTKDQALVVEIESFLQEGYTLHIEAYGSRLRRRRVVAQRDDATVSGCGTDLLGALTTCGRQVSRLERVDVSQCIDNRRCVCGGELVNRIFEKRSRFECKDCGAAYEIMLRPKEGREL